VERSRKAGQNPPKVVAPIEEEEEYYVNGSCVTAYLALLG